MGRLGEDLAKHTVIGVDTTPFIYLWEHHPHYFALAEELFDYLKKPEVEGVTSIITMIESCIHPQRRGRTDLVNLYERAPLYSEQVRTLMAIRRWRAAQLLFVPDTTSVFPTLSK